MVLVNLVTGSKELSDFLIREMRLEGEQYRRDDKEMFQLPFYELLYINKGDLERTIRSANCPRRGYKIVNSIENEKRIKEDRIKEASKN